VVEISRLSRKPATRDLLHVVSHLETQKNAKVPGRAIIDGVDKVPVGPWVQALFQTVSMGFSNNVFLRVIATI